MASTGHVLEQDSNKCRRAAGRVSRDDENEEHKTIYPGKTASSNGVAMTATTAHGQIPAEGARRSAGRDERAATASVALQSTMSQRAAGPANYDGANGGASEHTSPRPRV